MIPISWTLTWQRKGLLPYDQPFNQTPWNYEGQETVCPSGTFPEGIVDWIMLEVRDPYFPEILYEQRAGFVTLNGTIVDVTGQTGLAFYNIEHGKHYKLAVRSRNHLDVIASKYVQVPNELPYDFSQPIYVKAGGDQLIDTERGFYALRAGDYDADGTITINDYIGYQSKAALLNEYESADFNLDAVVTVSDFNLFQKSLGVIGASEIRYE